jgi:hypothetical protein
LFDTSVKVRCPGEQICDDYQGAVESSCLMEFGSQVVDIGAYQACMQCEKLPTKPLVQLQRMAAVVPDPQLQQYRTDAHLESLVDRIEMLAEQHKAGWTVVFDELELWEAKLLVHWINVEQQLERIARQTQSLVTQTLLQTLVKTRI